MELTLPRWGPGIRRLQWSLDPIHSFVTFSVLHRGISRICGRFDEFAGALQIGGDSAGDLALTLNVVASSINTGYLLRDDELRSNLFLDAARYPAIRFTGIRMVPYGPGRCRIQGTLTLRGIERPLPMRVAIHHGSPDAAGCERIGLRAKARVDRRMFRLGWDPHHPSAYGALGRQVTVTVEAQFIQEAELHQVA